MRELKAYRQTFGYQQNEGSTAVHVGFCVELELLTAIKRFRDKGAYKSTSQAIRELICRGLNAKV